MSGWERAHFCRTHSTRLPPCLPEWGCICCKRVVSNLIYMLFLIRHSVLVHSLPLSLSLFFYLTHLTCMTIVPDSIYWLRCCVSQLKPFTFIFTFNFPHLVSISSLSITFFSAILLNYSEIYESLVCVAFFSLSLSLYCFYSLLLYAVLSCLPGGFEFIRKITSRLASIKGEKRRRRRSRRRWRRRKEKKRVKNS